VPCDAALLACDSEAALGRSTRTLTQRRCRGRPPPARARVTRCTRSPPRWRNQWSRSAASSCSRTRSTPWACPPPRDEARTLAVVYLRHMSGAMPRKAARRPLRVRPVSFEYLMGREDGRESVGGEYRHCQNAPRGGGLGGGAGYLSGTGSGQRNTRGSRKSRRRRRRQPSTNGSLVWKWSENCRRRGCEE
jgi:hypothetical protein